MFIRLRPAGILLAACLSAALVPGAASGADTLVTEHDIDQDGRAELVMENRFVRVALDAEHGGMIRSYIDKRSGDELVYPSNTEPAGWFGDHPISMVAEQDYAKATFDASLQTNTPEVARVRMTAQGPGRITRWLQLTKTYELRRDSPVLRVHYKIENLEASMRTMNYGYRIRNCVGVPGRDAGIYLPATEGTRKITCGSTYTDKSFITHEPVDAWMAYLQRDGAGVVFKLHDYAKLMALYAWTTPGMHTMEFMTWPLPMEHGQSVELNFSVYPVAGLDRVDGATDQRAGALELDHQKINLDERISGRIRATSGQSDVHRVRATIRRVDGGEPQPLKLDDQGRFVFAPPLGGMYLIEVGSGDLSFRRAVRVGPGPVAYEHQPVGSRLGPMETTFEALRGQAPQREMPKMAGLDFSVEGPHIDWASPYFRRGPRVLFLADSSFHVGREVVELAQGFDIEVDWVHMVKSHWKNPTYETQVKWTREHSDHYLMEKLQVEPYDAIVVALNQETSRHLTEPVLEQIRRRRNAGVGVVWIASDGKVLTGRFKDLPPSRGRSFDARPWQAGGAKHYLNTAVPLVAYPYGRPISGGKVLRGGAVVISPGEKPGDEAAPIVVAHDAGRYREVTLNWNRSEAEVSVFTPDISPYGQGNEYDEDFPKYPLKDYYYLMLGKAVLWAAHHEPDLRLAELSATPEQVTVAVDNPYHPDEARIEVQVLDRLGRVAQQHQREVNLPRGRSSFRFDLTPPDLAGRHLVHVFINRGDKRLQFGANCYEVDSVLPQIRMAAAEPTVRSPDPVRVTATLAEALHSPVQAEWRLFDSDQRLIWRKTMTLAAGTRQVRYDRHEPNLTSRSGHLWLWLTPERGPRVCVDQFFVYVPDEPDPRPFDLMLDGFTESSLRADLYYRILRQQGFRRLQSGRTAGDCVKPAHNFDTTLSPFIWYSWARPSGDWEQIIKRYNQTRDKRDLKRWVNLEDPQSQAVSDDHARGMAERAKALGSGSMSYVDEFRYSDRGYDLCFSEPAMENMRTWLKQKYGSLDQLNQVWQSGFSAWDQVVPDLLSEARQRGVLSSWADHRRYGQYRYNEWISRQRRVAEGTYPQTRLIVSGTFRIHPWAATGPWQQATCFDGMDGYAFPFIREAQRCFMRDKPFFNYWLGYEKVGDYHSDWFWTYMTYQARGVSYWHRQQFMRPDFTLTEGAKSVLPHIHRVQNGLYAVLRLAQWDHGAVAMRYDPDSVLGRYYSFEASDRFARAEERWCSALDGVSAPFDVIASDQIRARGLEEADCPYRVLILPGSICISDAEAERLRRFVEDGGTLVADHTVGLMDENCVWRERGALDGVLGIRGRAHRTPRAGDQVIRPVAGGPLEGLTIPSAVAETGLDLADAARPRARAGDDPALWDHPYGRGRAFVFNLPMDSRREHQEQFNPLMRSVLEHLGIEAKVQALPGEPEKTRRMARVTTRTQGRQYYIGVENFECPYLSEIRLPEPMHVYALAKGEYLGHTRRFVTDRKGHLYAALPYRFTGLELDVPDQVQAGRPLTLAWRLGTEGSDSAREHQHVLNIQVLDANEQPIMAYRRNFTFTGLEAKGSIQTALNESPTLSIIATEPISLKQVRRTVHVVGRLTDTPADR